MQKNKMYKIAFGVGLLGLLLLGWVSGAVGIIGSENNPANAMYWAVPVVLLVGSLISRFHARGMSWALFATATIQFLIPLFALLVWPAEASWGNVGVIGVFIVNFIFVVLFLVSGLLFRRAANVT